MLKSLAKILKAHGVLPASALDRRRAQKMVAFDICKKFGLRLYHQNVRWPDDQVFLDMMRKFAPDSARIRDRNYSLFQLAKTLAPLKGDTAECGVYAATSSYIICEAMAGQDRTHHLFDSFEGLSEVQPEDRHEREDVFQFKAGDLSVGEEEVRNKLARHAHMLAFHKGWIPERFKDVKDCRFALVHLDVDLYQPTIDSLEFFYPLLVPGGMIICDDYGLYSCPGAYKAVNEYCEKAGVHPAHLTCGQAVIIKQM